MREPSKQKGFIPIAIVIAVVILAGVGTGYGIIYSRASNLIKETQNLTKEEKYDEAIRKLEIAQNKLIGKIFNQKINTELEKSKKLLEDKIEYTQGVEEFNKGNFEKSKELLSKVSGISPHYQDAKDKIKEAQKKITEKQIAEAVEKTKEELRKEVEGKRAKEESTPEVKIEVKQPEKIEVKEIPVTEEATPGMKGCIDPKAENYNPQAIIDDGSCKYKGTEVKGIISSNTIWSLANSPYIVTDNILVDENISLTIEPGVEIRFNRGKYIQIMGYLNAIGTKEYPIVFTSNPPAYHYQEYWELKIGKYREGTKGGNLRLDYCRIEHGIIRTESYAYGNRDFNNLMIENCTFDGAAIWTEGPGIRSYIKHNNFLNAINGAIYINTGRANPLEISYNNFQKNKVAIYIGPVFPSGVQIRNNNFYLDNDIAVSTENKDDINVSGNWWGTSDASIIDSKIHDFYDYFDLGKVQYQPIITSEIPDAGIQ